MKNRTKYSLVIGTLLILFFSLINFAVAVPQDIDGHWAAKQTGELVNRGIISGYADGSFKPDNLITRAEFVTMVNKAFGFSAESQTDYKDIKVSDWFAGEIAKAKAAGYISGYPDGTFKPNKEIERQEAAAVLAKVLKLDGTAADQLNSFNDSAEIAAWSKSAVNAILAKGIISGYPDKTFRPAKAITRAEAAVLLISSAPAPSQEEKPAPGEKPAPVKAPILSSMEVTNKGDISLAFDKEITIPSAALMADACAQFTVMVDGAAASVSAIESTNTPGKIKLVMVKKLAAGQSITIAYTKSENKDAWVKANDGGELDNFAAKPVR